MSTRAIIARPVKDGYMGRYHHSDGYPSGLGEALYKLYNGHFKKNAGAMMAVLIDQHTAGWSSIQTGPTGLSNFNKKPGYVNISKAGYNDDRPKCYCHGDRHEERQDYTPLISSDCDYLYVINESKHVMFVHARAGSWDGPDQWRLLAQVDLNAPEPDWEAMDK